MVLRRLFFLPALLLVLPASALAEPEVRVRIAEQVSSVVLSGRALRVEGRPLEVAQVQAKAVDGELRVAHIATRGPAHVQAADGVALDGQRFLGDLSLVPRADGSMDIVNIVPLELYVERAVAGEVYSDWPNEVLKAQAVVARTYALYQRSRRAGEPFDVEASVISQRYATQQAPARVQRAATETRGEYLAYRGEPILAAYHASAGGRTASAREVWGTPLSYLRSLSSPDDAAPDHFWSFEISVADLVEALEEVGLHAGDGSPIRVLQRSESGRVQQLRVGDARLSGRELRQILGGRAIRSALFDVRATADRVRFLGSGSGHGVGLSQWGARELALRGRSYREILTHYYPGTTPEKLAATDRVGSSRLSALP